MKKLLFSLLMGAAVLSSCTERKTVNEGGDNGGGGATGKEAPLVFNADVSDVNTKLTTDMLGGADKISVFTDGDQVGIFATTIVTGKTDNYKLTPYGYQRTAEAPTTGTSDKLWKAMGTSLVWQSLGSVAKTDDHSFYAFYPYNSATTTKEKVVLPSIADQVHSDIDFQAEEFQNKKAPIVPNEGISLINLIAPYDFLVAQKIETNYAIASNRTPKVAGALDMKFDHALSMIQVNVVRAKDAFKTKDVEVSSVMVTANTLTAKRTAKLDAPLGAKDPAFFSKAGVIPGTVGITFATSGNAKGEDIPNPAATQSGAKQYHKAPWLDKVLHAAASPTDATAAKLATPAKCYFVTYPTPAGTEYQFEILARSVSDAVGDKSKYEKDYALSTVSTVAEKFEPGKIYTFTISISDRALDVMDLTITDWVTGKDYPVIEI